MVSSKDTGWSPVTTPPQNSWLFSAWLASRRTVHGSQLVTTPICVSSSPATARRSSSSEYSSIMSSVMWHPFRPDDGTPTRHPGGRSSRTSDLALVGADVAQALHHVEGAALGAGDVHVHAHVVLTRHHLG